MLSKEENRRSRIALLAIVFGLACASPESTRAAILTDLFNGDSLQANGVLFDSFELRFLDNSATIPPDLSLIQVDPLSGNPLNPGLQFSTNGALSVVDFDFLNLELGFRASTLDGTPRLDGTSLSLDGFTFGGPGGFISIIELVDDSSGLPLGSKDVFADNEFMDVKLLDNLAFDPQSELFVTTNITVLGTQPGDAVSLNGFAQRFSQTQAVPEPASAATWGLLLAAVAAFLMLRRRRLAVTR